MERSVRIPVRVIPTTDSGVGSDKIEQERRAWPGSALGPEAVAAVTAARTQRQANASQPPEEKPAVAVAEPAPASPAPAVAGRDDETDWSDRALRLQAEMENYRKRQQQLAQDRIEEERQRLLRAFLGVVDDLERALQAPPGDGQGLRQGVELTLRAALQLLDREGVEAIESQARPFDPHWHQAVATVAHHGTEAEPDTVVQVMEPGYRLGDKLLRPAKVVVAV